MRFDHTDLRLFIAIVEAGSITQGAAQVHLSLPAASERLRDMEMAGGVRLLDRGPRGVTPTRAGEALAHHARLVLRQMERLRGELGEYASGVRATVRLLANTAAMTEFLPDRLGGWLATHPRVDIDLKERTSTEIVKAVSGGLADLGIVSDAVDPGGLVRRPFATDRLVLVVPREHRLAGEKRIPFASIVGEVFVGLGPGTALQDYIDEHAARAGERLKFRVRVRTFEGLCRLVGMGVGLGIVPETAARRCRRTMGLAVLPLVDGWATRRLLICFRSEEELPPVARDLVGFLGCTEDLRRGPEVRPLPAGLRETPSTGRDGRPAVR